MLRGFGFVVDSFVAERFGLKLHIPVKTINMTIIMTASRLLNRTIA
jgi:hypothetical protein